MLRSFAALRMTGGDALRMTRLDALRLTFQICLQVNGTSLATWSLLSNNDQNLFLVNDYQFPITLKVLVFSSSSLNQGSSTFLLVTVTLTTAVGSPAVKVTVNGSIPTDS